MPSPISDGAEKLVTHTNYITGPLYLIFNLSVLIWFYRNSSGYNDSHRNHYIVLLGVLILTDSFWSLGAVIFVRDKFIIYSPYSILPSLMSATTCMCILFFLFITIGIVYFSMVLSRYQHLLPSSSSLRFDRWRLTSLNYIHLLIYFFIPIFYCAIELAKDEKLEKEYTWLKSHSIYIVLQLTPFLKAIIAGLTLSITLLFSFVIKLYWRMHRSFTLHKDSTSVSTRQSNDLLCWALFLEIFLPILSFFLPAIALILGNILSCINPDLSIICLLFHNTHAFFICLIIAIYGRRHQTSPTRMVTDLCTSMRKTELDQVKLIHNPVNEITKEQNTMIITEYLDSPRYGLQESANETVSGVGPCVEIFAKHTLCYADRDPYIAPHQGKKIFDECGSMVKFLLTIRPKYLLAIGTYSLSVFHPNCRENSDGCVRLCEDDDEIVGHGKIANVQYDKEKNQVETLFFTVPIVFRSGKVKLIKFDVMYSAKLTPLPFPTFETKFEVKTVVAAESDYGIAKIVNALIVDKTDLLLIYEDTILNSSINIGRGMIGKGRQIVATGDTSLKGKFILATDDGEIHIAKVAGKITDRTFTLYDSAQLVLSSASTRVLSPTAFAMTSAVVIVGNKDGELHFLNKKNLELINIRNTGCGPITFLLAKKDASELDDVVFYGTESGTLDSMEIVVK